MVSLHTQIRWTAAHRGMPLQSTCERSKVQASQLWCGGLKNANLAHAFDTPKQGSSRGHISICCFVCLNLLRARRNAANFNFEWTHVICALLHFDPNWLCSWVVGSKDALDRNMVPPAIIMTNRSDVFTHHASMQEDFLDTECEHTLKRIPIWMQMTSPMQSHVTVRRKKANATWHSDIATWILKMRRNERKDCESEPLISVDRWPLSAVLINAVMTQDRNCAAVLISLT